MKRLIPIVFGTDIIDIIRVCKNVPNNTPDEESTIPLERLQGMKEIWVSGERVRLTALNGVSIFYFPDTRDRP